MIERVSLSESEIESLSNLAAGYGLLMRKELNHHFSAPISLLPTIFPKAETERLFSLTQAFNLFMYNMSLDTEFVNNNLAVVTELDDFIRRLVNIARKTPLSKIFLGLNRNDFFWDGKNFKQVEFNTMASSFGSLGTKVNSFHKHALARLAKTNPGLLSDSGVIPTNRVLQGQTEAFAKAYELYGGRGVVLFLVTPDEVNYFDQVSIEIELFKQFNILSVRATLAQVYEFGTQGPNNELFYKGDEVAIVYFRAGYSPAHYLDENHWVARELIDSTIAIKSPDIHYHVAGSKKLQQATSDIEVLSRYTPRETAEELIKYFVELWDLEKDLPAEFLEKIRSSPESFVLKPQREGGGNNFYGRDILPHFENYETDQGTRMKLRNYTLMKKINSVVSKSLCIRNGQSIELDTVSELGVFGSLVAMDGQVVLNTHEGYLVRTKGQSATEGGVAVGYSVLDSIYLE